MQLQLRMASEPKRSVLEMLRRKIEQQNGKVVAERANVSKARAVGSSPPSFSPPGMATTEHMCNFQSCFPSVSDVTDLPSISAIRL